MRAQTWDLAFWCDGAVTERTERGILISSRRVGDLPEMQVTRGRRTTECDGSCLAYHIWGHAGAYQQWDIDADHRLSPDVGLASDNIIAGRERVE